MSLSVSATMKILAAGVVVLAVGVAVVLAVRGRGSTTSGSNTTLVPGRDAFIYLLPVRGGASVNVTRRRGFPYDAEDPAWSPDGKKIAFTGVACAPCPASIYIMDARGQAVKKLAAGSDPAWSRRGWIAFVRRDSNGLDRIYLIRRDGSGLHLLFAKGGTGTRPAWSPDGKEIAFERLVGDPIHGNPQIFLATTNGRGVRRTTDNPAAVEATPAWSPDGKRIAFSNVGASGRSEIYVMNADGTGERKMIGMGGDLFGPTWSPDGRRVAFMSDVNRQQGVYSLYVVQTDGRGLTRLTDAVAADSGPAWAPDGKSIAFSRRPLKRIVDTSSQ